MIAPLKNRLPQFLISSVRGYASGKNLASLLYAPRDLRFEERSIPKPSDTQMLIKMDTVGICGSDIHFYKHFAIGPYKLSSPYVLGHEGGGHVVEMGKDVKGFKIGDRVTIEPGVGCRKCLLCKTGNYHLCQKQLLKGLPPEDGLFEQYVVHEADFCYKLPDNLTMDDCALLEPFCVAIHGARKGGITAGSKILILGAGPIGLMMILTAKAFGATHIAITDIVDHRLAIAKSCGADLTINVKGKSTEEVVCLLKDNFGELPDISEDCAGFQSAIELSIKGVRDGGRAVFVALASERAEIPIMDAVCREIELRTSMKYANAWPLALDLVKTGKVGFDKLTTTHYDLKDIKKGFEKSITGEFVKVLIKCNP